MKGRGGVKTDFGLTLGVQDKTTILLTVKVLFTVAREQL